MYEPICEWIVRSMGRPSVQQVLQRLQHTTVCTGAQCFDTVDEAFGTLPMQRDWSNLALLCIFVCVLLVARPFGPSTPKPSLQMRDEAS